MRILVRYPPDGPNDRIARPNPRGLNEHWSKPVVVENRPGGAAGAAGMAVLARSGPGGRTAATTGVFLPVLRPDYAMDGTA